MRAVPSGPATALLAVPRDVVVVEEEISLKFIEVRYFRSAAGNTSQQGPQHPLVHAGNGRKYNSPGFTGSSIVTPNTQPSDPPVTRPTTRAIASLPTPSSRWTLMISPANRSLPTLM